MIVDIGGGTTDIAVISLAGTVVSNSVKISSETFTRISSAMYGKHTTYLSENRPQRQ